MQPGQQHLALQPVMTEAHALLGVVQEFANQQSNAVLAVLQGETPTLQQHYPLDGPLQFAVGQWRAFYHCHNSPRSAVREHGHFHIFYQCAADDWRHVVALGMDDEGQPLDWFMVNRWVTGGNWFEAAALQAALESLPTGQEDESLAAQWLGAMLACYADDLASLAQQRETNLTRIMAAGDETDMLDNREIYELAKLPIDLAADIARKLSAIQS